MNNKNKQAVANQGGAMEAETISKNGRSSKSQMSRRNFLIKSTGAIACLGLTSWIVPNNYSKEKFLSILDEYDLTFSDCAAYHCIYKSGHPDRNGESRWGIVFGAKNGKLVFLETNNFIVYQNKREGRLKDNEKLVLGVQVNHLFNIPIDNIEDIQSSDYSVVIYWKDGRFSHATEFREIKNPNMLRNEFIKMCK